MESNEIERQLTWELLVLDQRVIEFLFRVQPGRHPQHNVFASELLHRVLVVLSAQLALPRGLDGRVLGLVLRLEVTASPCRTLRWVFILDKCLAQVAAKAGLSVTKCFIEVRADLVCALDVGWTATMKSQFVVQPVCASRKGCE